MADTKFIPDIEAEAQLRDVLAGMVNGLDPAGRLRVELVTMLAQLDQRIARHEARERPWRDRGEAERERRERWEAEQKQRDEQRAIWTCIPEADQCRMILDVIGEGRLTTSEVLEALHARLPDASLYLGDVRRRLMKLVGSGELAQEAESFKNKPRYRYYACRPLSGEIAKLDEQFNEGA